VFERFSEDARLAVVRAQEEARLRGNRHIGTAHLLLGAVASGRGARLLRSCGITVEQVRAGVGDTAEPGAGTRGGALPWTGSATLALRLAVEEADGLQHGVVGTDHLLIALARKPPSGSSEQDATSFRVLRALGAGVDVLRTGSERMGKPERPDSGGSAADPTRRVADQLERLSERRLDTDQLLGALSGALDLAEEEAIYFGRSAADGGDLLIGLAAAPDAVVQRALAELGLDPNRVRTAVEHAREDEPPP